MKELPDDNFKFDENGRKLSKWVENSVGKGEIENKMKRIESYHFFCLKNEKDSYQPGDNNFTALEQTS